MDLPLQSYSGSPTGKRSCRVNYPTSHSIQILYVYTDTSEHGRCALNEKTYLKDEGTDTVTGFRHLWNDLNRHGAPTKAVTMEFSKAV